MEVHYLPTQKQRCFGTMDKNVLDLYFFFCTFRGFIIFAVTLL